MSMKIGKCIEEKVIEPRYVMEIEYMHGDADGETFHEITVRKGEERVFEKIYKIFNQAMIIRNEYARGGDSRIASQNYAIDQIEKDEELINWFFPHEEVPEEYKRDWIGEVLYDLGWGNDITYSEVPCTIRDISLYYLDEENRKYELTVE